MPDIIHVLLNVICDTLTIVMSISLQVFNKFKVFKRLIAPMRRLRRPSDRILVHSSPKLANQATNCRQMYRLIYR